MPRTNETVSFNHQVSNDSYGYLSNGYGGLDWVDVLAMGKNYVAQHEPDTGFASALRGQGVGYTSSASAYAAMYNYTHAFTLKSGVLASAWDSEQPVVFYTITYVAGQGFREKGDAVIYLSQTARTVSFANYGNVFKNINIMLIEAYPGLAGNQGYYGYQVAMDNLHIAWSKSGVVHHTAHRHAWLSAQSFFTIPWHSHHHPHVAAVSNHSHGQFEPQSVKSTHHLTWHSELLSWMSDPGGVLTSEFKLPAMEHAFGI